MNLMSLPGVAALSMGSSLTDKIVLPAADPHFIEPR
jgi:hypothetical protein